MNLNRAHKLSHSLQTDGNHKAAKICWGTSERRRNIQRKYYFVSRREKVAFSSKNTFLSLFHAMDWTTTNQVGQRQWYWGGAQEEKKSDGQEFRFCHLTGGWSNTGATPNTIQRNRRSATKYSQDTKYWDRGAQIYRQLLSWSGRYIVCQKRSMSLVLDEQIFRPSVVLKKSHSCPQLQHLENFLKLASLYLLGLLTTLQSSQ